jgi:hypothetical protein
MVSTQTNIAVVLHLQYLPRSNNAPLSPMMFLDDPDAAVVYCRSTKKQLPMAAAQEVDGPPVMLPDAQLPPLAAADVIMRMKRSDVVVSGSR